MSMGNKWSWLAENRDKPVAGLEHQRYRDDLWIGGTDIACRYYLSMLTDRDYRIIDDDGRRLPQARTVS